MKGKLHNFELVEKILIEEKIESEKEFYIAITYDTDLRSAIIAFSQHGGVEVNKFASTVHKFPIFPSELLNFDEILRKASIKENQSEWKDFISKIVKCFLEE